MDGGHNFPDGVYPTGETHPTPAMIYAYVMAAIYTLDDARAKEGLPLSPPCIGATIKAGIAKCCADFEAVKL